MRWTVIRATPVRLADSLWRAPTERDTRLTLFPKKGRAVAAAVAACFRMPTRDGLLSRMGEGGFSWRGTSLVILSQFVAGCVWIESGIWQDRKINGSLQGDG